VKVSITSGIETQTPDALSKSAGSTPGKMVRGWRTWKRQVSLQGPDFRKYSRSGFSKVNYSATATSLYAFSLSIDTDLVSGTESSRPRWLRST
jgi:hypothetical protein